MHNENLICASEIRIGFVGSCFFIGMVLAFPFLRLLDVYGRKRFFYLVVVFFLIGQAGPAFLNYSIGFLYFYIIL